MTAALPFRLISEGDKRRIVERLLQLSQSWGNDWFIDQLDFQVHMSSAIDFCLAPGEQWMVFGTPPDKWFAWKIDGASSREWLGMIFGTPLGVSAKNTPLMHDMLQECVAGLAQELATAIGEQVLIKQGSSPSTLKSLRTGYGSGAILAELRGGAQRQTIALGGDIVEQWTRSLPLEETHTQLTPRRSAIGELQTSLEVVAGQAELTLRDIIGLEVGDVIQIDKKLGEAFEIRAGGMRVTNARLGIRGDHKAIQLIE